MNCQKFKDLIATDYMDMQLSAGVLREIREHFAKCSQCREFEQALRKAAVEPFKAAKEVKPPDFVWERIKESIQAEEAEVQPEGVFARLLGYLRGLFSRPQPVFALGTTLAVCIAVAVVLNISLENRRVVNTYIQEQGNFLSGLSGEMGSPAPSSQAGLGTTIEEYFL